MNVKELVSAAEAKKGRKELAREMGMNPNRLSDWKAGSRKPDATEVLYMAAAAGLEPEATLAEVMAELDPRYRGIWANMARKLRGQECALCQLPKRVTGWATAALGCAIVARAQLWSSGNVWSGYA